MSMKIRCQHKKVGLFRFLSGIQLSLIVDEALRRTGFAFEYTKGFNPRIKINFSLPAPVGVASVAELFDVSLKDTVGIETFIKVFNANIQKELMIKNAEILSSNSKPVINSINSYEYKIYFRDAVPEKEVANYKSTKGRILEWSIMERNNLKILSLTATAKQENYFNIGNFIKNLNTEPIIVIKTKTYMG